MSGDGEKVEKKRSSVAVDTEQLELIKLLAMANDMQVGDMACVLMSEALSKYTDELQQIQLLKAKLRMTAPNPPVEG